MGGGVRFEHLEVFELWEEFWDLVAVQAVLG